MAANKRKIFRKLIPTILLLAICFQFVYIFATNVALADESLYSANVKVVEEASKKNNAFNKVVGYLGDKAKGIGMAVIEIPLLVIRKFCSVLLVSAMDTMDLMLSDAMYEGVFFSPQARAALNTGWGLVRDFVNMFYVLILIFLAIATILRVNKFSDKKLLISVVLSALLVNFSKAIALFIIDISNLAMNFFMGNIVTRGMSYTELLADKIKFADVLTENSILHTDGALLLTLTEIIFTAVLAITLFFLALSLLIRLVAFWVLLVLSPLAFFGLALPGTFVSSLYKNWLDKMVYWAFFGPVLLFFLWLALVLVDALSVSKMNAPIPNLGTTPVATSEGVNRFSIKIFSEIIPFAAAIYFLFYGFDLSKKMASMAGSSVGGIMSKGQAWMNKGMKYSAIAGTGAVAGAGYLGYQYGKGLASDTKAAAKTRLEDSRFGSVLTKKGREEKSKERQAKWGGRSENYDRDKANENYKKMKDAGMTQKEVAKSLASGDRYEAAGAAKLLAEKGWLHDKDDPNLYRNALEAARKVKGMENQFVDNATKKNLGSVINFAISQEPAKIDEILDKHLKEKGVANFAEQSGDFFENSDIESYLRRKYAAYSPDVKSSERKKASDKINDPGRQHKMMDIIG